MMTFDVILSKEANNGYTARPVLWPDVVVHGETKQEALDEVRHLIRDRLEQSEVIQVEIDLPDAQQKNPWLATAGIFKDDPTWDDFQQAMADYRRQLDAEMEQQSE